MITALQFAVFFGYLAIIWKKFDMLQSISHSTYEWKGDEKYYFMVMCWMLGGLNLAQGMGVWGILTTVGLGAVGITVNFLDGRGSSYDLYIHAIGAILAVLCPFFGLFILHGIYAPFGIFLASVGAIMIFSKRNFVWWIEISAFALILISYALR